MKLSLILGHRGARFTAPENSVESFKNAVKCGADGVELDVHLTKDKKLIVIHDSDLRRITGSRIPIGNLTLKEIKSLDISHLIKKGAFSVKWNIKVFRLIDSKYSVFVLNEENGKVRDYFIEISRNAVKSVRRVVLSKKRKGVLVSEGHFSFESSGSEGVFKHTAIPELTEALESVNANFINIEIKRGEKFYPGISDKVVKTIEPFGFDRFLISSFNYETDAYIKKKYPFLKVNRLYEIPLNPVKAAESLDGANPLSFLIGKRGIEKLHRVGKTAFPWVVNKPISIAKFILFGADGIITDRPCFASWLKTKIRELLNEAVG